LNFYDRKLKAERPEIRTVVVSNSDKRITNVLLQLGLLPFLDEVVFSEQVSMLSSFFLVEV